MKIFRFVVILILVFLPLGAVAQEGEVESFEAQVEEKADEAAEKLESCAAGWRAFLAAGVGYESFTDYVRDFFLLPSHYADVRAVENQLNKARYAVMSAFLRCDTSRLKSATNAYYRLEAELYFLRHFVDTDGGFLRILSESPEERGKFVQEMTDFMILRKKSEDPEADRAIFSGYFNLFEGRYKERAKSYAGYGDDPIYSDLAAKFGELIETLKSFGELTDELGSLGEEAIVDPLRAAADATVAAFQQPNKALLGILEAARSKIGACIETDDNRFCTTGDSRNDSEHDPDLFSNDVLPDIASPQFWDRIDQARQKAGGGLTYEQVNQAITAAQEKKFEDVSEVEMRTRYEVLYGYVSGDGVSKVIETMDELIFTLEEGRLADPNAPTAFGKKNIPGSLEPIGNFGKCVAQVRERVCK